MRRYFRLLPAVVLVGAGLLAIKGVDLARAAQAPAANSDAPDNTGLAPTDPGATLPRNDFAADDATNASVAEVDVLTSLTRRRAELDARERALNMRENLLNAGEGRVDQKIAALKALQTQIQGLLTQRDAAQDQQIASLVKTYSTMKAKDAARIFNTLADDVLLPVAKGMKSDILAPILAAMNSDTAQKLTVKLANQLKLPDPQLDCPTTAALTPPADASAPAGTPPVQTAALTPSPVVTLTPPAQTPPAATPPAATPPAATPPAPAAATPPPPAKPATAAATPPARPATPHKPPHKPATAGAAPPAKPATASTPPVKPTTAAAATPPAKPATVPAAPPPPAAPPAGGPPPAASGPPAAITPPQPATGG